MPPLIEALKTGGATSADGQWIAGDGKGEGGEEGRRTRVRAMQSLGCLALLRAPSMLGRMCMNLPHILPALWDMSPVDMHPGSKKPNEEDKREKLTKCTTKHYFLFFTRLQYASKNCIQGALAWLHCCSSKLSAPIALRKLC
jgi:hypothetical protein